jgi:hypothetical protein
MLKNSRTVQTLNFARQSLLSMRDIFKLTPALLSELQKNLPEQAFSDALKNTTADEIKISVFNFWLASVGLWGVLIAYVVYLFFQTAPLALSTFSYVAVLTVINVFLVGYHIARLRLTRLLDFSTFLKILRKKPAICLPLFSPKHLAEKIVKLKKAGDQS